MTNWLNPTNTNLATEVLGIIRDQHERLGKLDFTDDTNIPTNFIRLNQSTPALEKWNGSSWVQVMGMAEILAGGATVGSDVVLTSTGTGLRSNTSDGSDSKNLQVSGGGGFGSTRGGLLTLHGNESASAGRAILQAGNIAAGRVEISAPNTTGEIWQQVAGSAFKRSYVDASPIEILGNASQSHPSGLITAGGNRQLLTDSYINLCQILMIPTQIISGIVMWSLTTTGGAVFKSQTRAFVAQIYTTGTISVDYAADDLLDENTGSVTAEFNITNVGDYLTFRARRTSGASNYRASVAVIGCSVQHT